MLVLHIGLPKTGTTLLQYRVLAPAPGITFLHRKQDPAVMQLMRDLRRHCQAGAAISLVRRPFLLAAINRLAAGPKPLVVSDESIALSMSRFWGALARGPEWVARRLGALGAWAPSALRPCKVIIGIRRQDRWLASAYAHCADNPRTEGYTQADFDRRLAAIAAGNSDNAALGWLDYARTRDVFSESLGAENVLMLPMERLMADMSATVRELAGFLGADLGQPRPDRKRPSYTRSVDDETWRVKRTGELLQLPPDLAAAVRGRFAASNAALAAIQPLEFDQPTPG